MYQAEFVFLFDDGSTEIGRTDITNDLDDAVEDAQAYINQINETYERDFTIIVSIKACPAILSRLNWPALVTNL